jgi:hypothetical protein
MFTSAVIRTEGYHQDCTVYSAVAWGPLFWIRICIVPALLDPDPHWQYGPRSSSHENFFTLILYGIYLNMLRTYCLLTGNLYWTLYDDWIQICIQIRSGSVNAQ